MRWKLLHNGRLESRWRNRSVGSTGERIYHAVDKCVMVSKRQYARHNTLNTKLYFIRSQISRKELYLCLESVLEVMECLCKSRDSYA